MMKFQPTRFRPFLIVVFTLLFGNSYAQKLETRPPTTGLVLEVVFVKDVRPAFQAVPWTSSKKGGSWYARFESNQLTVTDELRVRAVRVVPVVEGAAVRVDISVLRGKFHDVEDSVGSYLITEGQQLTIDDLRTVGVLPFKLRLFRVAPAGTNPPTFVYHTKSIEAVSIEALVTTLPAYKITVRNLSDRNISALSIQVTSGGQLRSSSLPQGIDGRILIPAGGYGEFQTRVPLDAERGASGFDPAAKNEHQIIFESLVFEDGTYEGSMQAAAMFRAFVLGRRIELQRLYPLISSALDSLAADGTTAPANLIAQVNSLTYEFPEAELKPLLTAFPDLPFRNLKDPVEAAIHGMRNELLGQAGRFKNQSELGPNDFREWLETTKDRYSSMLSRLK